MSQRKSARTKGANNIRYATVKATGERLPVEEIGYLRIFKCGKPAMGKRIVQVRRQSTGLEWYNRDEVILHR